MTLPWALARLQRLISMMPSLPVLKGRGSRAIRFEHRQS